MKSQRTDNTLAGPVEIGSFTRRIHSPGARSGAMIRDRQAQFGDVLLCLGGGTGVEHLADAYIARRKPVIPLDLSIGASREDGTGGAERLNREALANPSDFVRLGPEQQSMASTLLALLVTKGGTVEVTEVVTNLERLVTALDLPIAFYVRQLNPGLTISTTSRGFSARLWTLQ